MKLAILDLESMMYSKLYAKSKNLEEIRIVLDNEELYSKVEEMSLGEIKQSMDDSIRSLFNYTECTHYIGFLTSRCFRYDIYPEYKGQRKEKPKYYQELKQYLIDTYSFISKENYEADDLCSSCATYCQVNDIEYVVCNIDKDLDQIIGNHFNYRTNLSYYIDEFQSLYNLASQMFISQAADNIHPCKSIGEVACKKILADCKTKTDFIKQVINVYKNGFKKFKGYEDYKTKISLYFNLIYLKQDIDCDYVFNKI